MAGECSEDLLCSDCHTIHYSQDGGVPAEWGKEGPYEILLKNIVNDLCLMCHDGFDPNAPNVMGETRYIPNAGSFSSFDPNRQHSLGSQDEPPGYDGEWNGGILTCVSCHNPPCNISHGDNKYYRNLKTNPGSASNITVTYETSEIYGGEAAIQQLLDTPINEKYKVSNIKHRQSESGSNYGLSAWCAGCHTDFYGNGGDVNMGGSPSGDTKANNNDTWIRHPTKGITLSEGVTNGHIDGDAKNGLGYWWSDKILSRPPYISPSGDIGSKSSSDNETGCISCHKAHGSDQLYCLIFDNPETSGLEDGTRMVGTCQACHLTGGGYYETSPHGDQDSGLLRITDLANGECSQCHIQHAGNPYNLFTENKNQLCYTSGCHDFTPTGATSGYPAQEDDRAPAISGYPGYFEYFSGGERAAGLNNRVRWPGMTVFEDPNAYDEGPPARFFSPHRNNPEMPLKDSEGNGLCLNCHSPHGTKNPFDMLTKTYLNIGGAGETGEPENYELCFSCHGPDGPGGMDPGTRWIADYYDETINPNTAGHRIRRSTRSASYWPPHIQKGDKLACSNCHNPHGSRGYDNNNKPNTHLISDQRPGWNDLRDTIDNAAQCRRFCFGCHVPYDDTDCATYPSGCPEVDGIIMAQLPETTDPNNHMYSPTVIKSCYGTAAESCHGNDYSSSTSYNVHHPNPSPETGMAKLRARARSPVLSAPTGLIANPEKRLVELAWDKYTDTEIRGYNLYRGQKPGGPYKLITSQPDIITRYMDEEVKPERNYYYVLTVEDIEGKESPYSMEAQATPTSLTPGQLKTLEEVKGLSAKVKKDRIILEWEECRDEFVAGYKIYRRKEGETVDSVLITPEGPVRWPVYEDTEIEKDQIYIYSVVAVDKMGNEARFPNELRVIYKELFISKVFLNQEEKPLRAGQEMIVTLIGSTGGAAYFTIEGLSDRVTMEEIEDTGTYTGRYRIPGDITDGQAKVTCFLEDLKGNMVAMAAPAPLRVDNLPPVPPKDLKAVILPDKGVSLNWKVVGEKNDTATYRVYRSPAETIKIGPEWMIASDLPKNILEYKDLTTIPGTGYSYIVTSVDVAGNESEPSNEARVFTALDKTPPDIINMQIIGGMGVWKTGETITISMDGESGCEARFSIGGNIKDVLMQESPGSGRYRGQYVFRDDDKADDMKLIGKLTDPSGNFSFFDPDLKVSVVIASDGARPQVYDFEENRSRFGGDEALVAGDVLEVTVRGTPDCFGVFHLGALVDEEQNLKIDWSGFRESEWHDISGYQIHKVEGPPSKISKETLIARLGIGQRDYRLSDTEIPDGGSNIYLARSDHDGNPHVISSPKWNIPLVETEEQGVYKGRYIVKPGDRMIKGYSFVSLKDKFGRSSVPFQSLRTVTIDTGSRIEVRPVPAELKADSRSRSVIKVILKDAKGNSVPARQVGVALFTTSEYTGLVGSGRIHQSDIGYFVNASMGMAVGTDEVEQYIFTTNYYGEIEVDFEAGFAAKTVIFRARDHITGDVGVGYCTSYIETEAQVIQTQKRGKASSGNGYTIDLSSEDKWLTADGISKIKIIATIKSGEGDSVEGHLVNFFIEKGYGSLSPNKRKTDANGKAVVTYIAGKRIDPVEISATVTIENITLVAEGLSIILKSDAPAKIFITVEPNEIPVDGTTTCRLKIKVTDINGNPSRGVGFELSHNGDGKIKILSEDEKTDFNGEAEAIYRSGSVPGIVLFNLKVTSKIPPPEELEGVRWVR